MKFWSDDISAVDAVSPFEIMEAAAKELEDQTGALSVEVQVTNLDDRTVLGFEITNLTNQRKLKLFEAYHRRDHAYPAAIEPPLSDIPEFLKRKRLVGGASPLAGLTPPGLGVLAGLAGESRTWIENEWICATPAEFRKKMTSLFAEEYVKAMIFNLLASPKLEGSKGRRETAETAAASSDSEEAR